MYKAELADHLRAYQLYDKVPSEAWKAKFVVDIEPVGDGQAVLKYLAPCVNRVAISDKRIVSVDESSVTFRYTRSKSRIKILISIRGLIEIHNSKGDMSRFAPLPKQLVEPLRELVGLIARW